MSENFGIFQDQKVCLLLPMGIWSFMGSFMGSVMASVMQSVMGPIMGSVMEAVMGIMRSAICQSYNVSHMDGQDVGHVVICVKILKWHHH